MAAITSPPAEALPLHRLRRPLLAVVAAVLVLAVGVMTADRPRPAPVRVDDVAAFLATFPTERAAVGPIALDSRLAAVVARLGPPDSVGPDIEGIARRWSLAGGAQLDVSTPVGATEPVAGVVATIPRGSSVRIGLYGGILLGEASVDDVVRAWGAPEAVGEVGTDFDLRYIECRGIYPIVLKVQWEPDFQRVLVGYADEAPGSSGCGRSPLS